MTTILLVEDDNLLGKMVGNYFSQAGFEFHWARSRDEAFDALSTIKPDLIFLDIMLPGTDGLHILRELKANQDYKHIPVVMLSNLGDTTKMEEAVEHGAKDYVVKSNIKMKDLVKITKEKFLK